MNYARKQILSLTNNENYMLNSLDSRQEWESELLVITQIFSKAKGARFLEIMKRVAVLK